MSFKNIPEELRQHKNWVLWRLEFPDGPKEKGTKVPYQINGHKASVTNPLHWCSFDDAIKLSHDFSGIGLVLFSDFPYSGIDMDYSTKPEITERQINLHSEFNTYSEISPGGNGLHMWVKGKVPTGARRNGIEVYSTGRFLTMTGNVYNNVPICDNQELLTKLYNELKGNENVQTIELVSQPERYTDDEIIEQCRKASTGEQFIRLFETEYEKLDKSGTSGDTSQSVFDMALANYISFQTKNFDQFTRIFHRSKLGKRKKAYVKSYLRLLVKKAYDQTVPLIEIEGLATMPKPKLNASTKLNTSTLNGHAVLDQSISLPPGLMGELALYIYQSAPRPVPEIALAPAIALMAAICGRSYNVLGQGLNQYMMLLANTGMGKEHISDSFDKLLNKAFDKINHNLINRIQYNFRGPRGFMSGQALDKHIANESQSFVQIVGEFAGTLNKMLDERSNANEKMIHSILRDVYMKSGHNKIYKGIAYADKEKGTKDVIAPAVSILGESNPLELYNILSEQMATGGMLPRFLTIAYEGNRSYLNDNSYLVQPSDDLINKLANLISYSIKSNQSNQVINVEFDEASKIKYKEFETWENENYNKYQHSDRIKAFMWSRAPSKTAKLAAAIAIGINPFVPTITLECFDWACKLVCSDINNLLLKFDKGEIGSNQEESQQSKDMERVIKEYITKDWDQIKAYMDNQNKVLWEQKIITHRYFDLRAFKLRSFRGKFGKGRQAGKECIEECVKNGLLIPVKVKDYHGQCWKVSN